jgi:acyl carrier protein
MDRKKVAIDVLSDLSGKAPEAIEPSMDLVADLGIDSPKGLQLLFELEERLGIEITDEAAGRMDTVADVLGYLERTAEA